MTENRSDDEKIAAASLNIESILNGIYYYRIHHYIEQVALVNILPQFLEQHKKVTLPSTLSFASHFPPSLLSSHCSVYSSLLKVRLLVLDSVTFHFRRDFDDMSLRTRMLNTMAQNLMSIAEQYNLVVCSSHYILI